MDAFVNLLQETHALDAEQLTVVQNELSSSGCDPKALAQKLLERGWLTKYQVVHLLQGNKQGLLLGPYAILDKLGEGGMGQVFKARHQKLGRIVVVKLIRPDCLAGSDMVQRFRREMRAIAQVQHPNIVRAYDADEVNGVHYFSMEYVPGVDLGQLVGRDGPLPIAKACDFIRQTALGLQHAFERGLIHRDLKPVNLLVCDIGMTVSEGASILFARQTPLIKILDLGLARVEKTATDDSGTLTQEGMIMGTPDFMSPEQSINSKAVDIRSDLYSLGCTFYFLLTGRSPFSGRSLTDKLLAHQMDQPPPIEQFRPEIPDEVAAIIYRLLEKKPADRYQTPAELVAAIDQVTPHLEAMSLTVVRRPQQTVMASAPNTLSQFRLSQPVIAVSHQPPRERNAAMLAFVSMVGLTLIGVGVAFLMNGGAPRPRPALKPPPLAKIQPRAEPFLPAPYPPGAVSEEWIAHVQTLPPNAQGQAVFIKLAELNDGFDAGNRTNTIATQDDKVTALQILSPVTDISPLRALKNLRSLTSWAMTRPDLGARIMVSLADVSALKGLPLNDLNLQSHRVEDLSPLAELKLEGLNLSYNPVRNLGPLAQMSTLKKLRLACTLVEDLGPLGNLQLESLDLTASYVKDLTPLAGSKLKILDLTGTDVADLSSLDVSALEVLDITSCPIRDLTPLSQAKKLKTLSMHGVPWQSLEPLKGLALESIGVSYDPKHAAALAALAVKRINNQSAATFWKIARLDPEQEKWTAQVVALPMEEQIKQVTERLRQLNPQANEKLNFKQENGSISEMELTAKRPSDLRFLMPLHGLRAFSLFDPDYYHIANLEPLRGLRLQRLAIVSSVIQDVSPLADMPIEELASTYSLPARDWTAARTLRSLTSFQLSHPSISRVEPFAGLPLKRLSISGSNPRDLHALVNQKQLIEIGLCYDDFRHREALKAMTWLKKINNKPPDAFWKEIAEQEAEFVRRELVRLNPKFAGKFNAVIENGEVVSINLNHTLVTDVRPIRSLKALTKLVLSSNPVSDLSQLEGMPLKELNLMDCSKVTDISRLRRMPLEQFILHRAKVDDWSPLQDLPLKSLSLHLSNISDLTAVGKIKTLTSLNICATSVTDLQPVKNLPLRELYAIGLKLRDVTLLRGMPLERIEFDFEPFRGDAAVLRGIPTLHTINGKNAKDFLKEADDQMAAFQNWCNDVASKDSKTQVDLVIAELKRLNPRVGESRSSADPKTGAINALFVGGDIGQLSPVRALSGLRELSKASWGPTQKLPLNLYPLKGMALEKLLISTADITDLAPLSDMHSLKELSLWATPITNLSPLQKLRLEKIEITEGPLADITPLKAMKLTHVNLKGCRVEDLLPLRGMPVKFLYLSPVVRDLSPLEGMPLETLLIPNHVTDHSVLAGMPLKVLHMHFLDWRDSAIIRAIPTLEKLGAVVDVRTGKTSFDVDARQLHAWADWEDAVRAAPPQKRLDMVKTKLVEVNGPGTEVQGIRRQQTDKDNNVIELDCFGDFKDISPLRVLSRLQALHLGRGKQKASVDISSLVGMQLTKLTIHNAKAVDWAVLRELSLEEFEAHGESMTSLEPLRGMQLKLFKATYSMANNLEPLRGMPLKALDIGASEVSDLSPLAEMKLTWISISSSKVSDISALKGMPLEYFRCGSRTTDLSPLRGAPLKVLYLNQHPGPKDWSPLMSMPLEEYTGPVDNASALAFLRSCRPTLRLINGRPAEEFWRELDQTTNEPAKKSSCF